MQETDIQAIVQAVLAEIGKTAPSVSMDTPASEGNEPGLRIDLEDPTLPEARRRPGIASPRDPEGLKALIAATPARIGVGRCGPRPRTAASLLFLADHGVTQDALMHEVDPALLEELGFFTIESQAADRQEYLKRPDLGRRLTEASRATLRERCVRSPDVQIF
ncbi:MAG TPA: ethanolamine ammonia-lyase light chain EutC, partial [Desulfosarcina sp.]|nr:ethanolamine ammonia-lyase light chain EutC [Desulfosarcina sp.]